MNDTDGEKHINESNGTDISSTKTLNSRQTSFHSVLVGEIVGDECYTPGSSLQSGSDELEEPIDDSANDSGKCTTSKELLENELVSQETENNDGQSKPDLAIICSNGSYKDSSLTSYSSIQPNSFMEEEDQETLSDSQNGNMKSPDNLHQTEDETDITQGQIAEIKFVPGQQQSGEHNESKSIYNSITVMSSSSAETNTSQTTFLSGQSISSIQNLTEHPIIGAPDIPDGYSDAFTNDNAAAHYIVQQTLPSAQAINQHENSQVVFIQVPSSQNGNQVVMAHVTNGQLHSTNVPVTVTQVSAEADPDIDQEEGKRLRGKGRSRGRTKQVKQETTNVPLRPLAPRMFAVPISSPVLIAGPSGNSQVFTPVDQLQQMTSVGSSQVTRPVGQHFEVLGRCIMCFRFCRTTTYCRAEKNHTEVRAAACAECEAKGCSTVVCRRKRQHKGPNAYPPNIVINVALQRSADLKDMCLKNSLPPCFSDLQSLTVHHADCIFAQPRNKIETDDQLLTLDGVPSSEQNSYRKPTDYARGYLHPYSKEAWEQWLVKFCLQTGTNYRIRTGKRINKKTDHGLANHNGKIVVYRALETQLYNCALGGKPRRKALREGSRRRKARGSKLIGCSAVIHTRLVVTEEDWKALEITLPKLSAHLPAHDPRITANDLQPVMNSMILSSSLYGSDQGVTSSEPEEFAILGDVSFHTDTETELTNDQMQLINSLQVENLKKQTKSLISNCMNLIDDVSSFETLKTANVHVQSLYNQLKANVNHKRSRKRTANEANLVDDEVLEEGESRPESVNQVVLLQTGHD